ncbi:EcsC family protein [Persicitalea jodogahamensis]|uniref:ABC transporter-associated protein EcsC n=1 Tax=Persicitalea jodogahamensis TaxID=402147 RepID=A0A8J3G9A2_9BACT|nr:EcsC family protein [Persicitalea jodogahamensis]GHB64774.1 ABC transporter-associated protein EcsC [Persicitalea jodogahamensis]
MTLYEELTQRELQQWQQKMQRPPSAVNRLAKAVQRRINRIIPARVHQAVTAAIKQMTRGVLYGAGFTTRQPDSAASLQVREADVRDRIRFYKKTGATEGALTGAGGFWLALADFPLLLGIKMKMLFEIAALYGYPIDDYRERLYILHVFQLAFSSQERRQEVYHQMERWNEQSQLLPDDINQFDWLTFQLEYRDYIDLAKMAQLIPGVGAAVGLVVNYRLIDSLGTTAMNAYRMRWLDDLARKEKLPPPDRW